MAMYFGFQEGSFFGFFCMCSCLAFFPTASYRPSDPLSGFKHKQHLHWPQHLQLKSFIFHHYWSLLIWFHCFTSHCRYWAESTVSSVPLQNSFSSCPHLFFGPSLSQFHPADCLTTLESKWKKPICWQNVAKSWLLEFTLHFKCLLSFCGKASKSTLYNYIFSLPSSPFMHPSLLLSKCRI